MGAPYCLEEVDSIFSAAAQGGGDGSGKTSPWIVLLGDRSPPAGGCVVGWCLPPGRSSYVFCRGSGYPGCPNGADSKRGSYQSASAMHRAYIADSYTLPGRRFGRRVPYEAPQRGWEGVGMCDVSTMYRQHRLIQ